MQCPVCEYPHPRPRYRLQDRFFKVTSEEFILNHCPSCGLIFQDEARVVDRLADFYPSGYWWTESGPGSRLERTFRHWMVRNDQLRFVLQRIPNPGGKRLLDVGCGCGTFVREALEAGFDAYGVDTSAEAVSIARKEIPGRVFLATGREVVEKGESFDLITLFHTLEHIPDPFRYLKRLRKLLHRHGTLFVQVPNNQSYQARLFGPRWYGLDCPRHLYNFSTFSVLHLLGRAGFRIQQVRHFSLRDNAASWVSSLFPALDPMSRRVQTIRSPGANRSASQMLGNLLYFKLFLLAQPLAYMEAKLGRGATVAVCAGVD